MHSISYTNEKNGSGVARVVSTHNVFAFVQSAISPAEAQSSLDRLHGALTTSPPFTPQDAKKVVGTQSDSLDIALLSHKDQLLTLATSGSGIIFLKRAGKIIELVGDGDVAQGPPVRGDEYILTTNEFLDLIGGLEGLNYYFLHYSSPEIVEMMKTYENQSVTCGFAAIQYGTKHSESTSPPSPSALQSANTPEIDSSVSSDGDPIDSVPEITSQAIQPDPSVMQPPPKLSLMSRLVPSIRKFTPFTHIRNAALRLSTLLLGRRTRLVLFIVIPTVILIILATRNLNVQKGRVPAQADPIKTVQTRVRDKLREVDTEAFVNISGIESTLQSARNIIEDLSKDDKQKYANEIDQLRKEIDAKERSVTRIAETPVEEYFDLHMIAADASVTDEDFDGTNFYLLDSKKGNVYVVDSAERSHKDFSSDKYKGALQIAATERYIYVLTAKDGVYLVEEDRSTQVIKPDSTWGTVTDMRAYTGNIYLLDSKKKDIIKYPGVDEKTFGSATPYLVPELQGSVQTNDRMTIDGSVYTSSSTNITKYIAGKKSDFKLIVPHRTVGIGAVYTDPDLESLYVYDNTHKALYVVSKEGVFDRQWLVNQQVIAVAAGENGKRIFAITPTQIFEMEDGMSPQ